VKPLLRGWLHLISFEASLVLETLALVSAHGAVPITAIAVIAASVSAMFGTSALYHRGNLAAAWHHRLQRLHHAMIFLLIAGTATAVFLTATHGTARLGGLIMIWTLTLTAGAIHMAWMNAPERLVGGTFVGLGCEAGLALPEVWLHSGAAAGALMLAGGVLYIAGALSYHRRWPNPSPRVFGYHEVFHVYVCAAAAC
jgi:hemolysin III